MALSFIIRIYQDDDIEQCRALWRGLTERRREVYQDSTIGGQHPEDCFDKHLATVEPDQIWGVVHDSEVVGLSDWSSREKKLK